MDFDDEIEQVMRCLRRMILGAVMMSGSALPLRAQAADTVSIHLTEVDLRTAVQLLSQYIDRPVVITNVPATKVTLETPKAVRRAEVLPLLRATLESQNLELVSDTAGGPQAPYRIRTKPQDPPAQQFTGPLGHSEGPVQLYVVHLRHARAADVAAIVNALYGRAGAFGEMSASAGAAPTLSQQLQQNRILPSGAMTGPVPSTGAVINRNATLLGETTIIPDPGTNSLLVRASPSDYELIVAAVKEVDVRPLQTLIQVVIVEVRRDRSLSFGVDIKLPSAHLPGHPKTTYSGSQSGLGTGDAVLRVIGIGGDADLEATLRAAASRGDVSIVSRPTVLAINNEKAEINVGSQRPFVQLQRTLATDNAAQDQVVQYKDVGTRLVVRPTISADGYVMLEVTQEVSNATDETQFNAPIISTRSVQTQLLLKDGQTVVIGGLTDRQRGVTQSGVPLLSSIPWLGGLFGHTTRQTTETELYLFITPRVIKDDAGAEAVTTPVRTRAGVEDHPSM